MNDKFIKRAQLINEPNLKSTYKEDDCIFLLKDISNLIKETSTEEKEQLINKGVSYSEILPVENLPKEEYIDIFKKGLEETKVKLAHGVAYISELMYKEKGDNLVIVSLARAGSPIGILIKRYFKFRYNIDIPHYSISIIRGKGFDENAIIYILNKHKDAEIQFVDGWTGKGSITKELNKSIEAFKEKYGITISNELAVVADPACVSTICAIRKDVYMPNCCLNSTVSGLVSRTFTKPGVTGENDFHGAKTYWEWIDNDYSNYFIDIVASCFEAIDTNTVEKKTVLNIGNQEAEKIKDFFNVKDINKVKPSIGETTRVLLRRNPELILVKNLKNPEIKHILHLAEATGVKVQEYTGMAYECIGVIK